MKELIKRFQEARELPAKLSDLHYDIAAHYAIVSDQYEDMIPAISSLRKSLLEKSQSVAKAEKEYEVSEIGQVEKKTKIRLKCLEKLLSSVRRRMETLNEQAHNQY